MGNYKRPGTYFTEVTLPNTASGTNSTALGAFIGLASQGKTVPFLINSWNDYVTYYGGWAPVAGVIPEMAYAVYNFFNNGGRHCYILRVVGSASASAVCQLTDAAATPQSTVLLTAISPGTWANALYAAAVDRDATTGRFDLYIYSGGSTDAFIVERFLDVSVSPTDSRYVVSLINAVSGGSQYVTAVNSGSATTAPANRVVQVAPKVFAGGLVGSAPGTTEYQASFAQFDVVNHPLIMAIPGNSTTGVITSAITYAETRADVFLIIDTAAGLNAATAVSYAAAFNTSSFAAVYWPQLNMVDPNGASASQTRLTPPSGAVMGRYCETDAIRGVFKAPAGLQVRIAGAVSLETKLTNADFDTLNVGNVNALKFFPGTGIVVYGSRTLKKTAADKYVPVRRTLIYVERSLMDLFAFAPFEPNDERLWADLTSRGSAFLKALWTAGGLKGPTAVQAYYILCDGTNNTQQSIDAGQVNIEVGLALQQPAEFVVIRIGQWAGGSSSQVLL